MSLRRFLIASSLIVTPVATIGLAPAAFADTTASVGLSGTVTSTLAITSTTTTDASALPLSTAGNQVAKIADLTVTTNNTAGLTLTASTGNLTSGTDTVPFTVTTVDDAATAPSTFATASGSNYTLNVNSGLDASTGSKNLDLYIQVQNPTLPKRGSYNGTVTLTVTDNS
ncbi:hypothetical protein [Floridanema aerugineum]|jgi:hypothetical protein|uniref:Uncharacterized protein n=1 Tax=Floridaenema aerugineum BLCC-F46 TaxID=3153654 RepID=A0ABV4XK05_9CYAN